MKDNPALGSRFSYAHRLWLASFHVTLYRDRRYVQSRALVRTTSGLIGKRDIVAFIKPKVALPKHIARLDPGLAVVTIGIAVAVAILFLLHSLRS